MSEDRIKELKEVGLKEEELRKLTPRQAADVLVKKKVLTEVKEAELKETKKIKGIIVRRSGGLTEEGIIEEEIRGGKKFSIIKKPKKRFIDIEKRRTREEKDATLAHELVHLIHPRWNENRVIQESNKFFRRDPFDDIIGFGTTPKQQPKLQLGEIPFFSRQIKKGGVVSRFIFPKSFTNRGFRVQPRKKFTPGKIRMRFL